MKDVFVSVENDLDETFKQNELLKDRLLKASLTEDIKNLVITSCVKIKNKDLHDEIERISKESKDVSNEVTQKLSKRIVELEKELSKSEAKCIAFEIALQHKTRENNSLKTVQKENENFMASLQLENAHLKQTYKYLFESVQRSKVKTNHCDKVKVKKDFDEIETRNIELEYRVASLIEENEHLKLTYKNLFDSIKKSRVQTKTSNVTQNETENLKSQLFEFAKTQYEAMEEDEAESSVKHTRRYIARDRELAEDKLRRDYFGDENMPPVYPKDYFRRSISTCYYGLVIGAYLVGTMSRLSASCMTVRSISKNGRYITFVGYVFLVQLDVLLEYIREYVVALTGARFNGLGMVGCGLATHFVPSKFDTTKNRFLPVGDEFVIEYLDMDNTSLLAAPLSHECVYYRILRSSIKQMLHSLFDTSLLKRGNRPRKADSVAYRQRDVTNLPIRDPW
ncbi:hypothetical protein Tco_1125455 [Tanacetum coccineum]|uniref:Uncharacterized protein n=1 Tax=Tanacetum coccineum TaxID=301880 RepID=A0ABQ5JAE9_9ASTR